MFTPPGFPFFSYTREPNDEAQNDTDLFRMPFGLVDKSLLHHHLLILTSFGLNSSRLHAPLLRMLSVIGKLMGKVIRVAHEAVF